ncbi:hypothetical protein C8Q78DRAFT_960204 [Trametes maxima]|nr:hypothetical protein C8Q78DRAFT_960204 [Trametes maxima]
MSRSDAHGQDYDHVGYEGRNGGEHGSGAQDFGGHLREFMPRDGLRESSAASSRDFGGQEYGSATFYNSSYSSSPPPFTADRRPLTSNNMAGAGFPSFVAPRMLNSAQGIGVGAAASWNSKPGTYSASPNTARPSGDGGGTMSSQVQPSVSPLALNHHHRPSPPRGLPDLYTSPLLASSPPFSERDNRDAFLSQRQHQQQQQQPNPLSVQLPSAQPQSLSSPGASTPSARTTLWWGELEPWMDEEYAKQVCTLMGWDPVSIKVPRPAPDPITGQQANNPGYCFLTFPTQSHAASVLSQVNNTTNSLIMPNSTKQFSLNWASSVPSAPLPATIPGQTISIPGVQNPQYPKEYSIFVGDLAPEVSNSDLVAVFRNPVLGLRNDREPRFIRPFLSCKSAKIMLDPVTGVSRGYGFVRFTDEADQQRALIEMHGLYCLSRPMRISPATAKFKPAPGMAGFDFSQMPYPPMGQPPHGASDSMHALALPSTAQSKSVSAPLAGSTSVSGSNNSLTSNAVSNSGSASSLSAPSLSSGTSATSSSTLASASSDDALKSGQYANGSGGGSSGAGSVPSITAPFAQQNTDQMLAQRYNLSEESWKHHAQARAILSNLIGPNGEQLTSSDPYNTTVFVGGLSPLISEETLRTFFAPFGEIHYVKVPVGKHCGFVQFVRKPDAERAIEKMQGFPIGGSRIRLSWGRSQYKAAQAAAQAAQAAAFQAQYQAQLVQGVPAPSPQAPNQQNPNSLTHEQALQLLEKFGLTNLLSNGSGGPSGGAENVSNERQIAAALLNDVDGDRLASFNAFAPPIFAPRQTGNSATSSTFSPFSPDPNFLGERANADATTAQGPTLSHVSKTYAPWYTGPDEKVGSASGKVSPTSIPTVRTSNVPHRFTSFLGESPAPGSYQPARTSSRQEAAIARPEVTRRGSQNQEQGLSHGQEPDAIRDLNGTVASLALDDHDNSQSQSAAH